MKDNRIRNGSASGGPSAPGTLPGVPYDGTKAYVPGALHRLREVPTVSSAIPDIARMEIDKPPSRGKGAGR